MNDDFITMANGVALCSVYTSGQFMNPGPAPRPPADRPRLNLTPSIVGYPGNLSSTDLQSPSMRSVSSFTTAGFNSPGISRTASFSTMNGGTFNVIKEGYVKYKEGGIGSLFWKSKYAILRQTQLDFQKSEQGKISFTIQLKDVTGVTRFDEFPLCIEVTRAANPGAYPGVALRDQPQKTMFIQFKEDGELYEWQDGIYTRCPAISGVSNPTNFSHRIHVGFDPTNGAFIGLPPEWEKLLTASAITKEDFQKNPQAVIEVLEFYDGIQKRAENPDEYPSLMPNPPLQTHHNMQLGHGGVGTTIAPPRPTPPSGMDRQVSYSNQQQSRYIDNTPSRSQSEAAAQTQRKASGSERSVERMQMPSRPARQPETPNLEKLTMGGDMRRAMEEEARKIKEQQEQRERQRRDDAEQNRKDMEVFNAAIPKTTLPNGQPELAGESPNRYNPTRVAPAAPNSDRVRQQPPNSSRQITPQRHNLPSPAPTGSMPAAPRPPYSQSSREQSPGSQGSLRTPARPDQQQRQASQGTRQPGFGSEQRNQSPQTRTPNSNNGASSTTRLPAPIQSVKPLNVVPKTGNGSVAPAQQNNAIVPDTTKQGDGASNTKSPAAETRQKEVRMSSMSESEVMSKLRKIVTRYDPVDSYVKQRKIGQGASGSVYIAKVLADATSPVAKAVYKKDGGEARVAIKTMDLRNQPRKELIVNEIIVMKESLHPNIVNYLDSFLIENDTELWVIMEYMNGGALTDVIENNTNISEDQIAAICREVSYSLRLDLPSTDLLKDV